MQERLAKQGALGTETATIDVATRILNVLDNYDRAFQSVEAATNEEVEIVDAYKKTYDMILDAFAELNVTKVDTVGYEFNYEMHQAMMQMPSDEHEEGIVCQEFAMGWKFGTADGEKLIRPAMVVVAA
jgi:molecular chaperone GrpE